MKNTLPQCIFCNPLKQSEWTIVYGNSPTNHYAFCCTDHIPNLINSISNGKHGEVVFMYLEKWNTNGKYNEQWDNTWKNRYKEITNKQF